MKRVLIVDDDMLIRLSIAQTLLRDGFEVLHAEDGIGALEQTKKRRPDLIICDVEIPKLNGFELEKALRDNPRTRHIPVVFLTEGARVADERCSEHILSGEFLTKPFTRDQLSLVVQRTLSRKHQKQ